MIQPSAASANTLSHHGSNECHLRIELQDESHALSLAAAKTLVPQHLRNSFRRDGFIVLPHVLHISAVEALNDRLEEVLRGRYDRGEAPDKIPRLVRAERRQSDAASEGARKSRTNRSGVGPLGFSGNLNNVRVLQVINVHKSDRLFRTLATSPALGKVVAELAGWEHGARLAQDQVWAKPPKAAPLTFHRDSPYFMFEPPDVITAWVALDDMDDEIGPLEYVRASHLWGNGRVGSANDQFFDSDGGQALLRSAAEREGVSDLDVVSMAGLEAGGISIHDGRTWHGSGRNESKVRPRRGLGLHFIPAQARFTEDAAKSSLWRPYLVGKDQSRDDELDENDFPVSWRPGLV